MNAPHPRESPAFRRGKEVNDVIPVSDTGMFRGESGTKRMTAMVVAFAQLVGDSGECGIGAPDGYR